MSEKLKKVLDLRLACTVAAGVFGGLFVYRVFMWIHEWLEETDNIGPSIAALIFIAVIAFAFIFVRRLIKRGAAGPIKEFLSRHKAPIIGGAAALGLIYYILLIKAASHPTAAAAPNSDTDIALQMLKDGSLPDKPEASTANRYDQILDQEAAAQKTLQDDYLEFKKQNADYEGTFLDYKNAAAKGLLAQYNSTRTVDTGLCTLTVPGYYTERQIQQIAMKDPACK